MKNRLFTLLNFEDRMVNKILFLFSLVAFFLLNRWSVFAYDDFNYHYMYGANGVTDVRLSSLSDVFASQYHHYFVQNGRFLVHTLLQILCISDSKIWFDFANTIVFGLFQLVLLKSIQLNLSSIKPLFYLFFLTMLWFLLPGPNYCFLWMAGSLNYSWATTAALFLLYFYQKNNFSSKFNTTHLLGFVLLGFLLNATNEVISIGVSIALLVDVIVQRSRSLQKIALMVGAFVSTIFVVIAPGNFVRLTVLKSKPTSSIPQLITSDSHHPLIALMAVKVFIVLLLILVILYFTKKEYLWSKIKEYQLYVVVIFVSLLFVYFVHAFSNRAVFPASVLAFVILMAILKDLISMVSPKVVLFAVIVLSGFAMIEYVNAAKDLRANQQQFANQLEIIKNSNPKQTIFEEINYNKNRFVCTGLGVSDSKYVTNMGIARMMSRSSLLFLPRPVVEQLKRVDSDTIYLLKNISRLIVPIPEKFNSEFDQATLELKFQDSMEVIDGEYIANNNGKLGLFIVAVPRNFQFKNLITISIQSASSNHKLEYKIKNR